MSLNGLIDLHMDVNIQSKDKSHGVMELGIYWHDCNILLKILF